MSRTRLRSAKRGDSRPLVIAVCGKKKSGKTTLIEALLPELAQEGISVAVIKRAAHALDLDHPGADTDRLFRAGGDVLACDQQQTLLRKHGGVSIAEALALLGSRYDLVLVEGGKRSALPKLWLLSEGDDEPPPEVKEVIGVLEPGENRSRRAMALIRRWMSESRGPEKPRQDPTPCRAT